MADKGFTPSELEGLNHVVVELTLRKDDITKIKGLFVGYRPLVPNNTALVSADENFIWLQKGDHLHMLHEGHYYVSYIELSCKSGTNRTANCIRHSSVEHEKSIKRLQAIQDALKLQNRVNPAGLIDTGTYRDISDALKKEIESESTDGKTSSSADASKSTPATTASANRVPTTTHHGSTRRAAVGYTKKKSEITTGNIKRTTKYPVSGALERMAAKMQEIRAGIYTAPELPEIPVDVEERKKALEEAAKKADKKSGAGATEEADEFDQYGPYM